MWLIIAIPLTVLAVNVDYSTSSEFDWGDDGGDWDDKEFDWGSSRVRTLDTHPFLSLFILVTFVYVLLLNLAFVDVLRHVIKRHERNVVAWTTAVVVFSPFLAGIAYLLTWPKDKRLALPDE